MAASNGPVFAAQNVLRGFLMGGADIIPGVSGGTVALILGIYERLVTAISRIDGHLFGLIAKRQWADAIEYLDVKFLATLFLGIGIGVVSLAGVMHHLLLHHHMLTLAAFFGLIAASSWLVARIVSTWNPATLVGLIGGALFAFWLVSLPMLQQPPSGLPYIFFCGVVAICAMILPGISGAFILLLLGKYAEITGLIKGALHGEINGEVIAIAGTFAVGCAVGLIGFSKLLRMLLVKFEAVTMATLAGFMIGSLRKLWPFQRDLTPEVEELKHKLYEVRPLDSISLTSELLPVLLVATGAAAAVLLLDYIAQGRGKAEQLEKTLE